MKKLIAILLALLLCSALAACDTGDACTEHKDSDRDGKCDTCQAPVQAESESESETEAATDAPAAKKEYTLTVKLDNGTAVSGVKFTLNGTEESTLTTDADGCASATLAPGKYTVAYDYETLPTGCIPDTAEITVKEDSETFTLTLIDNNPDGSLQKPFFISEDVTDVSIAAGEEVFYNYRGAAVRHLEIQAAGISVTYDGTVYPSVDGTVSVLITPTIGEVTRFSLKNTTNTAIQTQMSLLSPLGSMENPIVLSENAANVSVPAGDAVCYLWTAEKTGVLLVTSQNELNNISMINLSTYAVSAMTAGSAGEYLAVTAGDEIRITVAATKDDADTVIDMALQCYAATEADPVPVIKSALDFSLAANASLTFSADTGKTVTVKDASVILTADGVEHTADESGTLSLTLAGNGETALFTLTNTQDSINGITVIIE